MCIRDSFRPFGNDYCWSHDDYGDHDNSYSWYSNCSSRNPYNYNGSDYDVARAVAAMGAAKAAAVAVTIVVAAGCAVVAILFGAAASVILRLRLATARSAAKAAITAFYYMRRPTTSRVYVLGDLAKGRAPWLPILMSEARTQRSGNWFSLKARRRNSNARILFASMSVLL